MSYMFSGCIKLNSINLSHFNTTKVKDMSYMFKKYDYHYFWRYFSKNDSMSSLDLSSFDTSSVTNMTGMFYGCYSLTSLNLSSFNTLNVQNMSNMFYACLSLTSLNLSNFITSNVKDMHGMFEMFDEIGHSEISSDLKILDISSFDTSKVTNMAYMFLGCLSLTSFNLSNFNTSKVENMRGMFKMSFLKKFYKIFYLISLDLSNFDTSKVRDMSYMFSEFETLSFLDLTGFDTSQVTNMEYMFSGCRSLTSLNLSIFNTSKVKDVTLMFCGCNSLEYLNLQNFHKNNISSYSYLFSSVPKNLVICYKNMSDNDLIFSQIIYDIKCYSIDCSDNWRLSYKKIVANNSYACIDNCNKDLKYKYEYNGMCYENCTSEYLDNNKCKCQLKECLECPKIALQYKLCTKCNYNYYPIEDDPNNIGEYIKCYNECPKGYFLDKNIYKKCYHSCNTCGKKGNNTYHYCLECNLNYTFKIQINNYLNCYTNCSYYYYFDSNDNYQCTINNSCPNEYNKLIPDKRQCIKNCENEILYKYEFENKCYNYKINISSTNLFVTNIDSGFKDNIVTTDEFRNFSLFSTTDNMDKNNILYESLIKNCEINENIGYICIIKYDINITNENDIYYYQDIIIENIEKRLIQGMYNFSIIDMGIDKIIKTESMTITLTNNFNQKNISNNKNNITSIDLDECISILKKFYNISNIYIKKTDVKQKFMKIPKIEYDFYSNLNISIHEIIKLNKSLCNNSSIFMYYPYEISESENIDEFNIQSSYYKDICYATTSDVGTDILLDDRKQEFIKKHKAVCQDECEFKAYNYYLKKIECKCKVTDSALSFANININETKLYENIKNVKYIANIDILICFDRLFSEKGFKNNIGFYTLTISLVFEMVSIILFYLKDIGMLNKIIDDFNFSFKNSGLKKNINKKNNNRYNRKIKNKKGNNPPKKEINCIKLKTNKSKNYRNHSENIKKLNLENLRKNNKNITSRINKKNFCKKSITITSTTKRSTDITNNKLNNIIEYREEELNDMEYILALKNDGRSYCQYYVSLLRTKYILIFSFYTKDYNSRIIKIFLLKLNFIIYFTITALFFNNSKMHHIYVTKGTLDLNYEIPKIIYSLLISLLINKPLRFLALSNDSLIKLKKFKSTTNNNVEKEKEKLKNNLSIKFILFFILSFVILLIFGFYLAMFCAVYKNTQYYLIKEKLIGFSISLVYPFGTYLIPGLFRIPALYNSKKKKEYVYKFSKFLQSFL